MLHSTKISLLVHTIRYRMKEGQPPGRPHAAVLAGIKTDGQQPVPPYVAFRENFVAGSYYSLPYEGGSASRLTACNDRRGLQHGRAAARPSLCCIPQKFCRDLGYLVNV